VGVTSLNDIPVRSKEVRLTWEPWDQIALNRFDVDVRKRHLAIVVGKLQFEILVRAVPVIARYRVAEPHIFDRSANTKGLHFLFPRICWTNIRLAFFGCNGSCFAARRMASSSAGTRAARSIIRSVSS